jgi:hypothetical protein
MIGSALGAWWWSRYRSRKQGAGADSGTIIYANTPAAADLSQGII